MLAPRDTPPAITAALSKQIAQVLNAPEMQKFFRDRGAEPMPLTPEATGAFIASEVDKWGKAVKQSGAQVD
ncbi:Tripartite tricarboxylate transporter family receptor [compost metagenome]